MDQNILLETYLESIQHEGIERAFSRKSVNFFSRFLSQLSREKAYRKDLIKRLNKVNSSKLSHIQKEKEAAVLNKLIKKSTDRINNMTIKSSKYFHAATASI